MFNVARPSQRYESYNGLNTSYVADPLASSAYEDPVDPWSGTGTPAIQAEPSSEFSNILGVYITVTTAKQCCAQLVVILTNVPYQEMLRYLLSTLRLSTQ
jgi:hypothetical protein